MQQPTPYSLLHWVLLGIIILYPFCLFTYFYQFWVSCNEVVCFHSFPELIFSDIVQTLNIN